MLRDRILVKPKAVDSKTESGLFIPEEAQGSVFTGTVVKAGPDCVVKEGDFIVFQEGAGMVMGYEDDQYLIMRDIEVHCVL